MNITIEHLTKSYGAKTAIHDLSLNIGEGMYGLLGPNGAGKTSLMRILATLLPKSGGEIRIGGVGIGDKKRIRPLIGYLPQDFSVYPSFTVYEAMDYLAVLSGIRDRKTRKEKIGQLLARVNLENQRRVKVRALSGGMKRRLGIAQAIVHDPQVLIVDEPTAGLDPEERIRFRHLLRDFSAGRIVIVSTHIVEDIEFTCEHLAVLKQGRLLFAGRVKDMLAQARGYVWTAVVARDELDRLRDRHTVIAAVSDGDGYRVRLLAQERPMPHAERSEPSIEDAYMKLTGEG